MEMSQGSLIGSREMGKEEWNDLEKQRKQRT
jgi:hypothetical protein